MNRRTLLKMLCGILFIPFVKPKWEKSSNLHDLYVSPKAAEDIRQWCLNQLDEISRRGIYFPSNAPSEFDIWIEIEKSSPYKTWYQLNE